MEVNARNHETPEVLPWIPPGQSIEETTNKFAHKKGSIASKINAEVAAKKKNLQSPDKKKKTRIFTFFSNFLKFINIKIRKRVIWWWLASDLIKWWS